MRVITSLEYAKKYFNEFKDGKNLIGQVVSVNYAEERNGYLNGYIKREIDLGEQGTREIIMFIDSVPTPKYTSVINDFMDEFAIDIEK